MADRNPDSGDDQFDRLAARSLAAAERAGNTAPAPRQRTFLPWIVTTAAVAFALGLIANPWFETSVRSHLPGQLQVSDAASGMVPPARVDALDKRVTSLETAKSDLKASQVIPAAPVPVGMSMRIAGLEAEAARLAAADAGVAARLDQMAAAASSTLAGRTEMKELFLLSAARRFVQAGRPFGTLERPLSQTFAQRDPAATDALTAWSAMPHSRDSLEARLKSPAKALAPPPPKAAGWWDRLVFRLSDVVQVRGNDAPGAGNADHQRVLDALQADDLDRAIAAMEIMPVTQLRDQWLADARRLLAAEQALDSLEMLLLATPALSTAPSPPVNAPQVKPPVPAETIPANTL